MHATSCTGNHLVRWLICGAFLTLVLVSWATPAKADTPPAGVSSDQSEQARGQEIVEIDVVGNRRVTKEDVTNYLKEKKGQSFAPEALAIDVRELWGSGFFDDIQVDLERRDAGIALRFIVRERPNVAKVEFEGNDEIDSDDLGEAVEVKSNTILSYPAIARAIQKIRDMYAEKGYFLAEASHEVVPQKNNEVLVKFKITEHNEVSVRRITFIGNENISSEELRAAMLTGSSSIFSFGSGGPFRQDMFERDIAVISSLYYDRGYLMVAISTPRIMLTPDRNGIEVSISIEEGPRFKIRQFRVYERGPDGSEVEPIGGKRKLRNMMRAKSGDYFNRAELVEDIQAVQTLYRDQGFANVVANPDTKPNPDTKEVDVIVPIVRGPLVHFERIEVTGNSKTRDKVIRREMEITEGHKFSETGLERSRRRITALGFFERVDISTTAGSADDKINAVVEVVEKPTGTFQVGAGFSSVENFIATAQIQQSNLFGNGQSLTLNAQLSRIRQMATISFYEPYFLDSRFNFSVDLYDQLRVFSDFSQRNRGAAVTWGYPLIEPELTASVTYTLEENQVSTDRTTTLLGGTSNPVSIFTRLPLANLFNDGLTSSVRPALTYDTRNDRLFPMSGIYLRGSTELALTTFGSDNEFWRNSFTGRFYYPLGGGVVIKLNTEAGVVTSPSTSGVPIFARYFLGGILDVRGFAYRSLGPRVALQSETDPNSLPITNGARIGGNLRYYQNLEFEFPIVEAANIRGVVFTDAGNAWNLEGVYCNASQSIAYASINPCFKFPDDLANMRTSWGFGLRWFSPLGPLRFEWGFPFSPLPYEESSQFQFTIGNFF